MIVGARSEAGVTLLELLIALAITLVAASAALEITRRAGQQGRAVADAADLSQSARVAADVLQTDLRLAGAAADVPLAAVAPAVFPARLGVDPTLTATDDRVTILYQPPGAPSARLGAAILSSDTIVPLAADPACGAKAACGFVPGMRAMLIDASAPGAGFDLITVATAGPGWIERGGSLTLLTRDYRPESTFVLGVLERAYYLDRSLSSDPRLMRSEDEGAGEPVLNGVTDLRFEYYAATAADAVSMRGAAGGTCVFDAGPPPRPLLATLPDPSPARLTMAALTDGPVCGTSAAAFDGDLLRVRRVRVRIQIAIPPSALNPRPPLDLVLDVTPPNLDVRR